MQVVFDSLKELKKMSAYEIHGWIGTSFTTSCATYALLFSGTTFYSVLAGLGAFFAGLGTAYYYVQKAKLIQRQVEYIEKKLKDFQRKG